MCGIAGIVHYHETDLQKLVTSLRHRGPDDESIYLEDHIALMHTRLAIQDVEQGAQPFHYGDFSIVFNGEIYNHHELRRNLTEFHFQTHSDTETLLYLFIKYRHKMYELIDGMFAFCIYDKKNKEIILARDRVGKKPLYYYQDSHCFLFASELNAIKSVKKLTVQSDAILCYLRTGLIWKPYTAYENVLELEAASYLVLDVETLKNEIHPYFDILEYYQKSNYSDNFQECVVQLEERLKRSVADRITASDVEVGVFLSGGIDSNLIAAFAAQIKPNIKTFTVKFSGSYDESHLARLTAEKYKTNHIELNISSQLSKDIEKILLSYGEPFMDSSAIPSYYVSREASQHVKVILGGDGADELFAGYRRYVPVKHHLARYFKLMAPLLKVLPKAENKQSLYNYLYRLIAMSNKQGLDYYLSATTDIFEDVMQFENNKITTKLSEFIENIFAKNHISNLKKMLYADYSVILFCDLLVKMDIASMANSLEVRSPFLSKYMLEFAPQLPDHYKINKLKTKFILRKLAEKYLSPTLINQPKRGFEVPLKKWVDHDLRDNIFDALRPGNYAENFIDRYFIQNIINRKIAISPEKRAKILWSLYCLEVWHAKA